MNCHETQSLLGPYLDSELGVEATQGIRDHLASCPDCAALFADQERFQRQLQGALRAGDRTPSVWQVIAERIASAERPEGLTESRRRDRLFPAARRSANHWSWWLWPSPKIHLGLAAVWLSLVILHFAAPEPDPAGPAVSRIGRDSPAGTGTVRIALAEQRRWISELLDDPIPAPPPPTPPVPPSSSKGPNPMRSV